MMTKTSESDRFVKLPSMSCPGCAGPVIRAVDDAACNTPGCAYYHGGIVNAWRAIEEISQSLNELDPTRQRRYRPSDQGLCQCSMYFALSCQTYCLRTGERHSS